MQSVWISAVGLCLSSVIGSIIGLSFKGLSHRWNDIIMGFCAGIMLAASVIGLILPATEMAGSAGCNRFFGTYTTADKGAITLVPGGITLMTCPDIEFEDKYMKALAEVKTYAVSKEELTLKNADGKVVIVYTAAPAKSAE